MATPTLSVIMPNYNHAQFLPRSLGALVNQSVQPLEIIVVDDGSTDNSVEVIKGFAARYPVIRFSPNEKNMGALASGLRALEIARGDFVFFTAADDEVLPGFFEKSLALLAKHPEAGISCTATALHEPHSGLSWHLGAGLSETGRYFSPHELCEAAKGKGIFLPSNTTIWRRDVFLEAGGFRADLKWHADTFVIHMLAFRYGICYSPESLGFVNVEPNSTMQKGRRNKEAHRAVCERFMELLTSSQFEQQAELIRKTGLLYRLEGAALSLLWQNQNYRKFITWPFLRKHLWYSLQVKLKPYTPTFIGNLYLKLVGYRTKSGGDRR